MKKLTIRQKQVKGLMDSGCTVQEIADKLQIARTTTYGHAKAIQHREIKNIVQKNIQVVKAGPLIIQGHRIKSKEYDLVLTLNEREKEAYDLLCQNLTNIEIANRLEITEHGVKKRLQNIYRKLGVESSDPTNKQSARRAAILYSGTKIEQSFNLSKSGDRAYTIEEIKFAAKKMRHVNQDILADLISFLEMA